MDGAYDWIGMKEMIKNEELFQNQVFPSYGSKLQTFCSGRERLYVPIL